MEMILERRPIVVVDGVSRDVESLAEQAACILGYSKLKSVAENEAKSREMLQWMAEKDIRPFANVQKYMDVKRAEMWSRWPTVRNEMCIVAVFVVSTWIALAFNGYGNSGPSWAIIAAVISIISGIAAVIGIFPSTEANPWYWGLIEIDKYQDEVPEFALQTAIDVKTQFPEAKFYICGLFRLTMTADPFLVLKLPNGKQKYLEVWNEPGFDQKRIE